MKICFYLDNESCEGIDFSNPEGGNPGIGGTQYMIWTLSYYLKKQYPDTEIVVLAPLIESLPKELIVKKSNSIYDALDIAKSIQSDVFVFRGPIKEKMFYDKIDLLKINSIMWSHNFEDSLSIKYATQCKYLKRNVCVSKEQYDRLRDHLIFNKSTYIYNALDFSLYNSVKNIERENIICYIGSIIPSKGFHILAKHWKKIKSEIPDAKLFVIGGGNLYDKNTKLGSYGIAEEKYEKKFIKYLIDNDGNIDKDVNFFGVIGGMKKIEIMSRAKIGVPNPTGKTETFGIGAVEFQALGIPVVTCKKNGYLNTVKNNKTGILVGSNKQIRKNIIRLLKNKKLYTQMSNNCKEFVNKEFDIHNICIAWMKLFNDIIEQTENVKVFKTKNYLNNFKWLREINRLIIVNILFREFPSMIDYEDFIKCNLKKILK